MRILGSILLAFIALLSAAGPALAQTPTSGAVREYAPGTVLSYRFGGSGYPSAVQSAVQTAYSSDWTNSSWNNSRLPTFAFSSGGSGAVYYSSSAASPCGTGNTQWLQCASNWGTTSWRIYVRNFSGAPYSNWTWVKYEVCSRAGPSAGRTPVDRVPGVNSGHSRPRGDPDE
jgi:hypothetical protein